MGRKGTPPIIVNDEDLQQVADRFNDAIDPEDRLVLHNTLLPTETLKRLSQMAEEQETTVSALVRLAIFYFMEYEPE